MTATAVNCDAAAKTSIDIATVSHGEIPTARAIAPKDTPTSPVAAAIALTSRAKSGSTIRFIGWPAIASWACQAPPASSEVAGSSAVSRPSMVA
jgi:hypothetical protein